MKNLLLLLILLSGCLLNAGVIADDDGRGLAIAMEADRRDDGFGDLSATLHMTLSNRHGEQSERRLRISTLETKGDGDKSLMVFDQPTDVKGTAFLAHTHVSGADDQWLFLPALKRVKRIASSNKSGPFMGSEFAYEDLASQEVDKYRHRYLRDEVFAGEPCFVNERVPVDRDSGYARQEIWLDKTEYRPLRIDFYDRKGSLLKTLTFGDYRQYLGRYWRAGRMEMINHQTGKRTDLQWIDYKFRNQLTERDFDKDALERAR